METNNTTNISDTTLYKIKNLPILKDSTITNLWLSMHCFKKYDAEIVFTVWHRLNIQQGMLYIYTFVELIHYLISNFSSL